MATTTITLRIDLLAVLSCGDLLKRQGVDTKSQPVSTTVRTALEAITELMRKNGSLPIYPEQEEYQLQAYEEMFGKTPVIVDPQMDFSGLSEVLQNKISGQDSISKIASEVDNRLGPREALDVRLSTEQSETSDIAKINIFDMFSSDFENLEKQAPKDKYIEICGDSKTPDVLRKAICITYTTLPVDQWGTPIAERFIKALVEQHKE